MSPPRREELDFDRYAEALAALIDGRNPDKPFTIAVHAPRGAGKSHLGRILRRKLEDRPSARGAYPHVTAYFNAWMHDDATHLGAALLAFVTQRTDRARPFWRRVRSPLPIELCAPSERRMRRLGIYLITAALTVAVAFFVVLSTRFRGLIELLDAQSGADALARLKELSPSAGRLSFLVVLTNVGLTVFRRLIEAGHAVSSFVIDPKSEAAGGSIDAVKRQLDRLIEQATPPGSDFVLFVDELELCRPPQGAEVLEVVDQLLSHPRVVTVLLADLNAVAAHAEIKYRDLADVYSREQAFTTAASDGSPRSSSFGWQYLEKFVHLQFDLPRSRDAHLIGEILDKERRRLLAQQEDPLPQPTEGMLARVFQSAIAPVVSPLGHSLGELHLEAESSSEPGPPALHGHWRAAFGRPVVRAWSVSPPSFFLWFFPLWLAFSPVAIAVWLGSQMSLIPARRFAYVCQPPRERISRVFTFAYLISSTVGASVLAVKPGFLWPRLITDWGVVLPWLACVVLPILLLFATVFSVALELRATDRRARAALASLRAGGRSSDGTLFKPGAEELIREQARRAEALDDADLYRCNSDERRFLPPLPGQAIRLIHDARLYALLDVDHHLFTRDEQPDKFRLIWRWAILKERWPQVARAVRRRPELMTTLERDARDSGTSLPDLLDTLSPDDKDDSDLRDFLRLHPPLSRVARRFVDRGPDLMSNPDVHENPESPALLESLIGGDGPGIHAIAAAGPPAAKF